MPFKLEGSSINKTMSERQELHRFD